MYECTFVVLGATGDLSKRKLIPAIYRLLRTGTLKKFALVGAAITDTTAQEMLLQARSFIDDFDAETWKMLEEGVYYQALDFHDAHGYKDLCQLINDVERLRGLNGNRIFYLATLPEHFAVITENLSSSCIVERYTDLEQMPWARIVYEKPFGYDLASAQVINQSISRLFDEKQIYRIDHYLGKELIGNIALLRFTNRVFEPQWCNKDIESVQIVISESIGIEGRGLFFERVGVLRDMVQSHMLQMLALVAMEAPEHLSGDYIRNVKAAVLAKVRVVGGVLGQYDGYREEYGVSPESDVETFAALELAIDNPRWEGVPFYLKTGKHLAKKETAIHLNFKKVKCLLAHDCPADTNFLTIRIYPHEGIYLELNAKVPGQSYAVRPVVMTLPFHTLFGPNTPEAYETLLSDVLRGDQSAFVREDEIELSWKIIDAVKQLELAVYNYERGSEGPEEMQSFGGEQAVRWRS